MKMMIYKPKFAKEQGHDQKLGRGQKGFSLLGFGGRMVLKTP